MNSNAGISIQRSLTLAALIFICITAFAAETKPNPFQFNAYVDGSYNYLVRSNHFTSGLNDRVFDLEQNGLTLQQAAAEVSWLPEQGFGGLINMVVGRDAYTLAPYGWDSYFGSQTLGIVFPDAYIQYNVGHLTLAAGCYETLVGEETYQPLKNFNFSHSILALTEPNILLGVHGIYKVNDQFQYNVGLNNGWSGIRDLNRQPTLELGGKYIFNSLFNLEVQSLTGMQRLQTFIATGPISRRSIIDFIAIYTPSKALTLVATYDYAVQNQATLLTGNSGLVRWQGIAGYVNYQWNDKWRWALRGEIYEDPFGYTTGVPQNWREVTATIAYVPIKSIELRAETRHDFSNVNGFVDANGRGVSNNQQSYALEGIYSIA